MSIDNLEDAMKVIVVGDGNVGKTTMLRRYTKGTYGEQYKKTIGAEFSEKEVYLKDLRQSATMMLWDTAGQEVFNALTSAYYRDSAACVLAFSTIDRDSFQNVINWRKKVEAQCGPIVMVICQTKYDLAKEAAMTNAEADALAAHLKLPFFRISTKEDFNVAALFEFVAKQVVLRGLGGSETAATSLRAHPTTSENNNNNNNDDNNNAEGRPVPNTDAFGASVMAAKTADGPATTEQGGKEGATDGNNSSKDKKDNNNKKEKKEKDANGNNIKPIQMKEIKKKDKKEKKKGGCVLI